MIKLLRVCLLLSLLVAAAPICHAQFPDLSGNDQESVPAAPPWTQFNLDPKVRVKLDFRNASVDAVIHTLSTASGVAIVKDPALTGRITLQSPRPQSLSDAFGMFNAILNLDKADMTKSGNFLLITVRPQNNSRGGGYNGGGFNQGGGIGNNGFNGGGFNRQAAAALPSVLQVYQLRYADATNLATTINNLYPQTPANGNNNAPNAQAVVGGGGNNAGGFGAGGGGGFRRGGGGAAAANGVTGDIVKASADEFSNSLIVNAPERDQDEIQVIISQIDRQSTQPQTAEVFKLTYAFANDLLPVVQNILTNTQTLGRGTGAASTAAANQNQNRGGGGFFGGFGNNNNRGSSNNLNGSVTADTRTNSLIVTTTQTLLDQVSQVIENLDKPTTYESSTYLYVMKSARADVVANLLNESLGNRETNGPTGGALTTTGASQPTVSATSSSSSTVGSSSPTGNSTSTNRGGSTSNNTSVTSSNNNLETQGLDEENRIVNIRNLAGNVLLVPNVDTNSIIVVCPPEDWPIVQSVLQQMDVIPQQVMIDVLVVEASLDKTDQFGIEYGLPANHGIFSQIFGAQSTYESHTGAPPYTPAAVGSLPAPGASEGLVYTLSSGQYSLFLQAAATDTKLDVLSTPRIFTTNNATAQINVSESVPYETGSTVSNGITQNSYDFLDVGLVLTVTPRVTSSGYVTMDVSQTDNSIATFLDGGTEPEVNQREAQTTVSVMDGRTVCLGGIIQNSLTATINKVPLLSDIPLLGSLFKNTSRINNKDELLVFLTPHVISNSDDAERVKDETEAELGSEARSLIPKAPPVAKTSAIVSPLAPTTTVSVTAPAQTTVTTTPPSSLGPIAPVPPTSAGMPPAPTPLAPSMTVVPATIVPVPVVPTPASPAVPAVPSPAPPAIPTVPASPIPAQPATP